VGGATCAQTLAVGTVPEQQMFYQCHGMSCSDLPLQALG